MRSPRYLAYIVVVGLGASCTPRPKLVYVDIDKAATVASMMPIEAEPPLAPPARIGAKAAEIPPMPKRVVSFPVTGDPLQQAREIVAKSERDAVREIAQRLSKTYMAEIDNLFQERKRTLDPLRREQFDSLFDEIRRRFSDYARKRGPLLVALAARVGWPDPDPGSLIEPDSSNPRRLAAFQAAKSLREQIRDLDSRYDKDIADLFAQHKGTVDQAMAELMLEIEDLRAKKLEQAEAEARKQVETVRDQIHSLVVGDPSVKLDSVPRKVVAFPSASPSVPNFPRRLVPETAVQEAKADLEIWLAQNRYQLGLKGKAEDATKDFIEWRNKMLNGR